LTIEPHKCYTLDGKEAAMPTKNPRVSVVLEKPLYQSIKEIAKRDGVTLSVKLRDIAREAIEIDQGYGKVMGNFL